MMGTSLLSYATFNTVSYLEVHQIKAGLEGGFKRLFIPVVLGVHQFEICL